MPAEDGWTDRRRGPCLYPLTFAAAWRVMAGMEMTRERACGKMCAVNVAAEAVIDSGGKRSGGRRSATPRQQRTWWSSTRRGRW